MWDVVPHPGWLLPEISISSRLGCRGAKSGWIMSAFPTYAGRGQSCNTGAQALHPQDPPSGLLPLLPSRWPGCHPSAAPQSHPASLHPALQPCTDREMETHPAETHSHSIPTTLPTSTSGTSSSSQEPQGKADPWCRTCLVLQELQGPGQAGTAKSGCGRQHLPAAHPGLAAHPIPSGKAWAAP